jgi:hypothetical protein
LNTETRFKAFVTCHEIVIIVAQPASLIILFIGEKGEKMIALHTINGQALTRFNTHVLGHQLKHTDNTDILLH